MGVVEEGRSGATIVGWRKRGKGGKEEKRGREGDREKRRREGGKEGWR
jgi:hypothetical protein